eukprot:scaffold145139_cov40-Attheya_sp.AAC.1
MSSWADASDDAPPAAEPAPSGPPRRQRLQLKPRSATAGSTAAAPSSSSSSGKSNPFGAAKPREEVLASKGIDAKLVDARIQKKAAGVKLTREQEMEVEGLREELTVAEQKLRDANEMELPEEQYRVVVDGKRTELKELMETFTKLNLETPSKFADSSNSTSHKASGEGETSGEPGARPKFERPSERRKRLEEQHGGDGGYGDGRGDNNDDDNAFSSFQGNRGGGRNRSDSGSGGKGRYHGRGSDQFHD